MPDSETHIQTSNYLIFNSEFITFSLYRIWTANKISGKMNLPFIYKDLKIPKLPITIVSPHGTREWYPDLVALIHSLLVDLYERKSPTDYMPIIITSLLYVARICNNSLPHPSTPHETLLQLYQLFLISLIISHNRDFENCQYSKNEIDTLKQEFSPFLKKLDTSKEQFNQWISLLKILRRERSLCIKACLMKKEFDSFYYKLLVKRQDLAIEILEMRKLGLPGILQEYSNYYITDIFD